MAPLFFTSSSRPCAARAGRSTRSVTPRVALAAKVVVAVGLLCAAGQASAANPMLSRTFRPVVEDVVAAFAAPFPAVVGGAAYVSGGSPSAAGVCARANGTATTLPLTYALAAQLYGSLGNASLDPLHGCYVDGASQECAAWVASTAPECAGRVADALGSGAAELAAKPQSGHAFTTSAAALAGLVGGDDSGPLRLRLSRSLRQTREVNQALDTLVSLRRAGMAAAASDAERAALDAVFAQRAGALVLAHHDAVMDKYDVLRTWMPWSLGAAGDSAHTNAFVQPGAINCGLEDTIASVLQEVTPENIVVTHATGFGTLASQSITNRTRFPSTTRALLCLHAYYVHVVAAIEDSHLRGVARMLGNGTLSVEGPWPAALWDDYLSVDTIDMARRFGIPVEASIVVVVEYGLYDSSTPVDRVDAVTNCLIRALLQAGDEATGLVPPSVTWCFDRAMSGAAIGAAVPGASLAASADAEAGLAECPLGWSVFDGGCNGTRTCTQCPAGTVADASGVCSCADPNRYVTRDSGCVMKPSSADPPTFTWTGAPSTVVSGAGDDAAPLVTVSLPMTALLNDPSAYLRVSVSCKTGLTAVRATPVGRRSAVCTAGVVYQRHTERVGLLRPTGPEGAVEALTYAESLTLEVVSTGGVGGDGCSVSATVGSALNADSASTLVGNFRATPRAADVALAPAVVPASGVPACEDAAATVAGASAVPRGEVRVGVCRSGDAADATAVFVDPRAYHPLGPGVLDTMLRSAATGHNRSAVAALAAELGGRVGLRLSLLDASGDVLGSAVWTPASTDGARAAGAWQPVLVLVVGRQRLEAASSVQVEVLDTQGTQDSALLAPTTSWMTFSLEEAQKPGPGMPSSSGSTGGDDSAAHDSGSGAAGGRGHVSVGFIVAVVVLGVLLLLAVAVLCVEVADLRCGGARALRQTADCAPEEDAASTSEQAPHATQDPLSG